MIIRTKKEFMAAVLKMAHPIIDEHDYGHWSDYASSTCRVYDKNNLGNCFYLPTIKYNQKDPQLFEKRTNESFIKYEKWRKESCKDNFTSKLPKIEENN